MNASDISNAITAMGESIEILRSMPYTDNPTFLSKWVVIEKLRSASLELRVGLSAVPVQVQTDK